MYVLDTDMLSHLLRGHARVKERVAEATTEIVLTVATRIEQLQGRFAAVLKAEDGANLDRAQQRLHESEKDLNRFRTLLVDAAAAVEFDRLLRIKGLRRIGRGDLLIATITLANGATLVTRNVKHFRQVPRLRLENWVD